MVGRRKKGAVSGREAAANSPGCRKVNQQASNEDIY
jgi:hypothetical protein